LDGAAISGERIIRARRGKPTLELGQDIDCDACQDVKLPSLLRCADERQRVPLVSARYHLRTRLRPCWRPLVQSRCGSQRDSFSSDVAYGEARTACVAATYEWLAVHAERAAGRKGTGSASPRLLEAI
jgi:hypothetical protein